MRAAFITSAYSPAVPEAMLTPCRKPHSLLLKKPNTNKMQTATCTKFQRAMSIYGKHYSIPVYKAKATFTTSDKSMLKKYRKLHSSFVYCFVQK